MIAIAATTRNPRQRRMTLDDAAFVNALDLVAFRDAPAIARQMLRAGHPATLATITAKMAEFMRETDAIEARRGGWRIKTDEPANDDQRVTLTLRVGDCLDLLKDVADASVDLLVCDLPYGVTKHAWDHKLNLEAFWREVRRISKPRTNVLMFGSQPFVSDLIESNPKWFRFDHIWLKSSITLAPHAKTRPLSNHEHILVFSPARWGSLAKTKITYNPQNLIELDEPKTQKRQLGHLGNPKVTFTDSVQTHTNYPRTVLAFDCPPRRGRINPTQKPVDLLEYLIRTYSNEDAMILDPTAGSGSTAVAAWKAGRSCVLFEKFPDMAEKARAWVEKETSQTLL